MQLYIHLLHYPFTKYLNYPLIIKLIALMILSLNSTITFGRYKNRIINVSFYEQHFNFLLWLHKRTIHKLDDELLKICQDLREIQFQDELVEYQDKMNNMSKSSYDKYAHTSDPYYIPGEDGWSC